MDGNRKTGRNDRIRLQEAILSTLIDYRALSTADVASIIDEDRDSVHYQLTIMADVGQIEHRETRNQDVWLMWKG